MHADVLIVGAGHAGAQLASLLRTQGYQGSLMLLGDEPDLPYERPPLSKDYLSGQQSFEQLLLRSAAFWDEKQIQVCLGQRVVRVDAPVHQVETEDGQVIGYGTLVWATGGAPRRMNCAGALLRGVHSVRTRADVDRMMAELDAVQQVVVVGGGYIGLEAAAVLTGMGKQVTLLEAQNRVLARVAGEALSRFYEAEHRAKGVDIRLGVGVSHFEGHAGQVSAVVLNDGTQLPAEMVVVGIGIIPAVAPLQAAGLACANGVEVDEFCRTALPDVFAIGDCAAHRNPYALGDGLIRLESVQNANDQAKTVARYLTGQAETYDALPWFWSEQYDLKLQTVGLSTGHDQVVVRGEPASRSFSVVYLKNRQVIAIDSVNLVRDFVQGKALVKHRVRPDLTVLADAQVALKAVPVAAE